MTKRPLLQRALAKIGEVTRVTRSSGEPDPRDADYALVVEWAYAHYLKRKPDEEGRQGFVRALRNGMTPTQLANTLKDSDEARSRLHSGTQTPSASNQDITSPERRLATIDREIQHLMRERGTAAKSLHALVRLVANPRPASKPSTKVSVILPVWNRAGMIGAAIESVLSQENADFELIVIDDGSDDGTADAVRSFLGDERVRLIRQSRAGSGAARNSGLAAATGGIIAYLDSDNCYFPGYLAGLAASYAATDAKCGYAAMLWDDGVSLRLRLDDFDWSDLFEGIINLDMNCFSHVPGLVAELGGFDESLERHNDHDLALRYTKKYKPQRFEFLSTHYQDRTDFDRITTSCHSGPAMAKIRAKSRDPIQQTLRVLIVADSYPQLSESYIDTEIGWMKAQGVDVHVLSLREPGSPGRAMVPVHRGEAHEIIRTVRPDIIHSHWLHTINAVCEPIAASRLPVTIRGHGFDFSEGAWQTASALPYVRRIYHFQHLVETLPAQLQTKAAGMPACFNSRRLQPGTGKDRKLVLRAAACLDSKDLETFFEAAQRLPDHRFVLVLARIAHLPQNEEKFVVLNRSLGQPVEIRFDVQHDEMAELYRKAGIYLHTFDPAFAFGMPVSILEAMATGCLVLLRQLPAARVFKSPGVLAYQNASEAVRHIESAGAWPEKEWRDRTAANVERAYEKFADERVLPRLLDEWLSINAAKSQAMPA